MNVRLVENIANELRTWSDASSPLETGGILIGLLTDDGPWITQALQVETTERSSVRYELPAGVTRSLVEQARTTDERLGYIGDWHSHPADIGPSGTDLRSLGQLARAALRLGDRPPVMIVVRRRREGWVLDARRAQRFPWGPRPSQVVLTGPPE